MTRTPEDVLRPLVTEAVREALADLRRHQHPGDNTTAVPASGTTAVPATSTTAGTTAGPAARQVSPGTGSRAETVRLTDDRDLDAFVRRIVALCDNPRTRAQLIAGQLRFSLGAGTRQSGAYPVPTGAHRVPTGAPPTGQGPAHRVERGAVTERAVVQAAERGQRLLLGRRAVLTPLARDRARTLGVAVEKER